jgi:hypothetical protein
MKLLIMQSSPVSLLFPRLFKHPSFSVREQVSYPCKTADNKPVSFTVRIC